MKYIPNKSYGYPVQRQAKSVEEKNNADYIQGNFDPVFSESKNPENQNEIVIDIEIYGLEKPIKDAIGKGQAELSVIVQCRNTFFTEQKIIEHKDASQRWMNDEMIINANKLNGEITSRAIVVAIKDFTLRSESINPEFGYNKFSVIEGMLLAESAVSHSYVNKEMKNNPQSIVSISIQEKYKGGEYKINLDQDYIEVIIGNQLDSIISPLKNSTQGRALQSNILYVPVITFALNKLQEHKDEYMQYKWAQVLTAKIEDLEGGAELDEPHNQAQAIFNNVILTKIEGED